MYGRFMADPRYVAARVFYSQVDKQFPLLTTFDPVAIGKPTVFEVPSIWNAAVYALHAAQGGYSGPTIKVYRVSTGQDTTTVLSR